jgi:hypothetical protein
VEPIFMGLAAVASVATVALIKRASRNRVMETWNEVARRLGGAMSGSFGWLGSQLPRVEATIDGVAVTAECRRQWSVMRRSRDEVTQVTAQVQGGWSGTLSISPQGLLAHLGKALGIQDVVVGDRDFDDDFLVQTDLNEELLVAWLRAGGAVETLKAGPRDYTYGVSSGVVMATGETFEEVPGTLEKVMRAVAALARAGQAHHADWTRLAGLLGASLHSQASFFGLEGQTRLRGEHLGIEITLDAVSTEDQRLIFTRLRAPLLAEIPSLMLDALEATALPSPAPGWPAVELGDAALAARYRLRATDPAAASALTPQVTERLLSCQPARLWVARGSATLFFATLLGPDDSARLRDGMVLLGELVRSPGAGPYR